MRSLVERENGWIAFLAALRGGFLLGADFQQQLPPSSLVLSEACLVSLEIDGGGLCVEEMQFGANKNWKLLISVTSY